MRPHLCGCPTFTGPLPKKAFTRLVASMHATDPPCDTLALYIPRAYTHRDVLLTRIHREDGVRIGDVLEALQDVHAEVLSLWQSDAKKLTQSLQQPDWTTFTFQDRKEQVWKASGFPKVLIFLENSRDRNEALAKRALLWTRNEDGAYKREWMTDIDMS